MIADSSKPNKLRNVYAIRSSQSRSVKSTAYKIKGPSSPEMTDSTKYLYDCLLLQNNKAFVFVHILYSVSCVLLFHTGKCKSTGAGCNELVQSKLRTGVRLKWRKR